MVGQRMNTAFLDACYEYLEDKDEIMLVELVNEVKTRTGRKWKNQPHPQALRKMLMRDSRFEVRTPKNQRTVARRIADDTR